jgi:uncharacterized protein (TIGR03118 family)
MQTRRPGLVMAVVAGMALAGCSGQKAAPDETAGMTGEAVMAAIQNAPAQSEALQVSRVDLVSDEPGAAAVTDPDLVNAWGLTFVPGGLPWVSSAERGLSQAYDSAGHLQRSASIPLPPSVREGTAAPTGQVFNGGTGFMGDRFIIVTEDGAITGLPSPASAAAELRVDNSASEAVYKGVTIVELPHHGAILYAADFHNARVDMFDQDYTPIDGTGRFEDPALPPGYAPFNVVARGPFVFVAYAQQNEEKEDEVAGPGKGYVNVFDATGKAHMRLISGGALNAPWGLEVRFCASPLAVDLLVGNFGDGRINAYRLSIKDSKLNVELAGPLMDANQQPVVIDGLWAINFGTGANGFLRNELYFTAGPDDEEHGLFGKLIFPTSLPTTSSP